MWYSCMSSFIAMQLYIIVGLLPPRHPVDILWIYRIIPMADRLYQINQSSGQVSKVEFNYTYNSV